MEKRKKRERKDKEMKKKRERKEEEKWKKRERKEKEKEKRKKFIYKCVSAILDTPRHTYAHTNRQP